MKNLKLLMSLVAILIAGAAIGIALYKKVRIDGLCVQQERETCRIIGALLSLAETHYGYWGFFPALDDIQSELVADKDESLKSYLDAYGRAMRIVESSDKVAISSAGQDGVFGTSDDIVGNASRTDLASYVNVMGPVFCFNADREWTLCETRAPQCKNQGIKMVLRDVELGGDKRGFLIENIGDEIILKVPDMGIEYIIVYETNEGERNTIKNSRSPFDTFKLMPLESSATNPEGNTTYYFTIDMPKDCMTLISARIKVYAVGFDVLKSVSNTEMLRRHMIGEPIELNITFKHKTT